MDENGKLIMNITAKMKPFLSWNQKCLDADHNLLQRFFPVTYGSNWNLINEFRIKDRIFIILRLTTICTGERYGMSA